MASPSDPVRPPNKKRKLKTQMRPAGPGALNKKKKRRVRFVGEEAEAEDKRTRIRSRKLNTDKTPGRELRKGAVVVSPAASTAAADGPAQLPLTLPSVPANPSIPGQRYGERLVFCAPYHSIIQRYRLSESPEPAPSPSPPPVQQYREQSVTATAAESAAGPAQLSLSLLSAPANPSTPGQRYGERVVFCAPYHSIIQRYRLSDSPEPAPSPSPPPVEQYREQSVTAAAAESAAGPSQPSLSLPSAPANPSTPGQRCGERVVFCAPYRSIIQRYRLSDSPEPAPSPSPPPVEQYREQSVTAAAAESAAGPSQPSLSLPSAPANPSTPGQRCGERVVFCAPYRSIIQRYRLSDSPEPAPEPPLAPAPLHPSQGEPEHEPTVRE